jgi:lipopolysaccharide/colanic/teichoic acid biosynthesis glycosyltransferase
LKLRIVLCGCTGVVGRLLVPRLSSDAELILVGRDVIRIAELFPGIRCVSYEDLEAVAGTADLVANLSARNNDQPGSLADFEDVNVRFMLELAGRAVKAGARRFVNFSTFHVLLPSRQSGYALSKAKGELLLAERFGVVGLTIRMPVVYGEELSGRLKVLERVPRFLRRPAFAILSSLRPTLSAARLAAFLLEEALDWPDQVVELSDDQDRNPIFVTVKRSIDLIFAIAVIGLFWWLLGFVWFAVRMESSGPGIFAQRRLGRGGREFTCYKFRTMLTDTKQAGTHEVGASAVTKVGRWLRRTKLDELPQVANLLRNEISLVGPRPCLPAQSELIAERAQRGVFSVKPGITGLAQINDIDMSAPRTLAQWDRRYAMTRSLPQELRLILATFIGRGQGDRVDGKV